MHRPPAGPTRQCPRHAHMTREATTMHYLRSRPPARSPDHTYGVQAPGGAKICARGVLSARLNRCVLRAAAWHGSSVEVPARLPSARAAQAAPVSSPSPEARPDPHAAVPLALMHLIVRPPAPPAGTARRHRPARRPDAPVPLPVPSARAHGLDWRWCSLQPRKPLLGSMRIILIR